MSFLCNFIEFTSIFLLWASYLSPATCVDLWYSRLSQNWKKGRQMTLQVTGKPWTIENKLCCIQVLIKCILRQNWWTSCQFTEVSLQMQSNDCWILLCFSVAYDKAAEGKKMCEDDSPMGVPGGKLEKQKIDIRYTYSVSWIVSDFGRHWYTLIYS